MLPSLLAQVSMLLSWLRCSCGQLVVQHSAIAKEDATPQVQLESQPGERWSALKHTKTSPTDAFGVLEFQGGGHVNKAMVTEKNLLILNVIVISGLKGFLPSCSTSGSPLTPSQTPCST